MHYFFTFKAALDLAKSLLSKRQDLINKGLVQIEAEELVRNAYRKDKGIFPSKIDFYSKMNDEFSNSAKSVLLQYCEKRINGETLQHITGVQFFLNHEYEVGPEVLVPRPETEILVSQIFEIFQKEKIHPQFGLEVGLGSGILSIELLIQYPNLKMISSELKPQAIAFAIRNANRILGQEGCKRLHVISPLHDLEVLEPFQSHLLHRKADFIVTNPPYLIQTDEIDEEVIRNEPHEALYSPLKDPIYFYKMIEKEAQDFLCSGGFVFAEVPHERATQILKEFSESKWGSYLIKDLTQRNRVLVARLKN